MSIGTLDVDPGQNGGVRIQRGSGQRVLDHGLRRRRLEDARGRAAPGRCRADRDQRQSRQSGGALERSTLERPPDRRSALRRRNRCRTINGPISVHDVDGGITARATNGPIGLVNITGAVRAVAPTGNSVSGSGEIVDVETQNGPISVDLKGTQWAGELNGRAQNGPLSVKVADDFTSGVEISSSRAHRGTAASLPVVRRSARGIRDRAACASAPARSSSNSRR